MSRGERASEMPPKCGREVSGDLFAPHEMLPSWTCRCGWNEFVSADRHPSALSAKIEELEGEIALVRGWLAECQCDCPTKAALAEPVDAPPCPRQLCSIDHCEEYAVFCGDHGPRNRCQHQAADASLDCPEPAVLCEAHGGHDGCAAEINRLQARIAEPVDVTTFVNEGRRLERDEIARALDAEAGRHATRSSAPVHGVLGMAAQKVRDGSIREWLPKDDRNAE